MGEGDFAVSVSQVDLVLHGSFFELEAQQFLEGERQGDGPIFISFSLADNEEVSFQVDVFDSQAEAFLESQSAAIEEAGDQVRCAFECRDN